jgi:hypothetical protein
MLGGVAFSLGPILWWSAAPSCLPSMLVAGRVQHDAATSIDRVTSQSGVL